MTLRMPAEIKSSNNKMPHDGADGLPDWVSASEPDKARAGMSTDSQDQPLLKLAEVANLLRISTKTVRRIVQVGSLPALRLGRALRFERDQISFFLNNSAIHREWVRPRTGLRS